jgi:hypothetical protein
VRSARHKKPKAIISDESHDGSSERKERKEVPKDTSTTKTANTFVVSDVHEMAVAEKSEPFEDEMFKDNVFASFKKNETDDKERVTEMIVEEHVYDVNGKEAGFDPFFPNYVGDDGLTSTTDEFDSLSEKDTSRDIETNLSSETIFEAENEAGIDDADVSESADEYDDNVIPTTAATSLASRRSSGREKPWETPKYRRDRIQDEPRRLSVICTSTLH